MKVEYHPDTVNDLNRGVDFYEQKLEGLGNEFRKEVYRTIDKIESSPIRFRKVKGEIRRCFVNRFPYSVLYRVLENKVIRVLVIRHHRQMENYGLRRT